MENQTNGQGCEVPQKVRNIIPIVCYEATIEPGAVWERLVNGYYRTLNPQGRVGFSFTISAEQAADTRCFKPIEEPKPWPFHGDEFLLISNRIRVTSSLYSAGGDKEMLESGNCFHPETRKNKYGVNIDDMRKMWILAAQVPDYATRELFYIQHNERRTEVYQAAWKLLKELDAEHKPR